VNVAWSCDISRAIWISNLGHFHFVSNFDHSNEGLLLEIKSDLE
jgi:hypothetical protein